MVCKYEGLDKSKCGALEDARSAFDELEVRDVITWNIIIAAYAQFGYAAEALKLFGQMDLNGIKRDVISWNAVISGCCQNVDYAIGVMCLFDQMHKETEKPDSVTCVSILGACTILGTMPQGKFVHAYVVLRGIASSDVIFGNALVNMYGKCGDVDVAYLAFQRMHNWNVVSWTSIIACYVRHGFDKEAFQLFRQMQLEEIKPDKVTFLSLLVACSNLTDLAQGKEIHAYLTEAGLGSDHVLGTALVDMYGKCGSVKIAHGIFKKLHRWDVVSWTAMIAGYAMHGYGKEALQLYDQMQQVGFKPNAVTFTSVLSAFGHAGLLDEGYQLYISMIADYRVTPSLEHHGCIVGLLGQDGWLDESEDFIANVPIEADIVSWTSLLGVCGVHKDVKRGNRIAKHVLALRTFVAAPVLSSLKCNQQEVARPKELVESHRPCSTIEVNDEVHQFFVGDLSHPQAEAIYAELDMLNMQMKKAGYIPDPCLASPDVWEDTRKQLVRYHSEKLALAFGLISISSESTLHIIKNTQICSDCHLASKFISNIRNREIVIRDSTHVHRFKNGTCSCGK